MSQQPAITIKVPAFLAKFNGGYFKRLVIELIQTAAIAGALAGLTAAGNQVPQVSEHYGWNPLVTFQLVSLIGAARAFVSGLNSEKVSTPSSTGSGGNIPSA